jgi:N-acetylmuramoyl-L-alanine amidase
MQKPTKTPSSSLSSQKPHALPSRGLLFNLGTVILAAVVLATLFTAWTPGEATSETSIQSLSFASLPTPLPTAGLSATPRQVPLIGIVSGHWGHDSGSVCMDGLTEVDVNQKISSLIQKLLAEKGYDVDLLKEFDLKLSGYKASVLISIHSDSCDYINADATGFKVAAALANPHPERATRLTACLRSRYSAITGQPMHSTSVTEDMTDYHAFNEIDPNTTAAIIETGFLNLDRNFLTEQPDVAAQGIVDGILCYLNNESISTPTPLPNP